MWCINPATGAIHYGDLQPGERQASAEEVTAYQAVAVTPGVVQAECARRIAMVVTDNQKLDMLGSMIASHIQGVTSDDANFVASMQWIAAMKAACAPLVGNVNYTADSNWPALPAGLAAFGARF